MFRYNFNSLLKINNLIKSPILKLIGIFIASKIGMRFLSVRIDPILACNLRCKMCHFSSGTHKKGKGSLTPSDIEGIAKTLFPKAFQVVVGCGAEPTLNVHFKKIVRQAHQYKVPNISLVTNGLLLNEKDISDLIDNGLHEIILSMHGVTKSVYESFMPKAKHEHLLHLLESIQILKNKKNTDLPKVRINYTVNDHNLSDLKNFNAVLGKYSVNTLQIRPIRDLGGVYNKTLSPSLYDDYREIVSSLANQNREKKITILAGILTGENKNQRKTQTDAGIIDALYCYISPETSEKKGINWKTITPKAYFSITKWNKKLLRNIFQGSKNNYTEDKLNYELLDV